MEVLRRFNIQWIVLFGLAIVVLSGTVRADVLYDTLYLFDDGRIDGGVGNAIGGKKALPSLGTIDSQVADDFEIPDDYEITRIVRDMMSYLGTQPGEGIWVQFYPDDGGKPSEDVYADYVVPVGDFEAIDLGDVAGFQGWRFDMDLSAAGLVLPTGKWWMDVQPLDIENGDWFWSMRSIGTLIDSPIHVRDGWQEHGNDYYRLYGSPDWIELDFRGNGSLSMLVEGVPGSADCLQLSLDQLVGGDATVFTIADGTPGRRAVLVFGFREGQTVINGLGGYCATFGIEGVQPKRILDGLSNTFNANGEITIRQFIPKVAQGRAIYFQAAERSTCPNECVSNLITEVVQ